MYYYIYISRLHFLAFGFHVHICSLQIGAAITIYVFRGEAEAVIVNKMQAGLDNFAQGDKYEGVTETWNAIQSDFHCCGVRNYTDWRQTAFGKKENGVPDTCCKTASAGCGKGVFAGKTDEINTRGCYTLLEEFVVENAAVVGGIGVGIAALQIVGVLISCMLAVSMRRRSGYV